MEMKTTTETARQRLRRQDCALVVIDIQEKLLPPIHTRERLVRNAQLLLRLAHILDLPIIATTQYARGLGGVVPEIASLLPSPAASDKLEFSCFSNQDFCGTVKARAKDRNTLLLCGMETHICVMQTALGALDAGYLVHVAAGTELLATLDQKLSTKTSHVGDPFTATVQQNVNDASGAVAIPAGAKINGQVVESEKGKTLPELRGKGKLNMMFSNISLPKG